MAGSAHGQVGADHGSRMLPAPILFLWIASYSYDPMQGSPARFQPWDLAMATFDGVVFSLMFAQITLAGLGGMAIAREREDRSAEFLAYLPVSRARRMACKLALPAGFAVAAWLLFWVVSLASYGLVDQGYRQWLILDFAHPDSRLALGCIAAGGAAAFGVGWFFSTLVRSHVIAQTFGLATPLLLGWRFYMNNAFLGNPHFEPTALFFIAACSVVAIGGFAVGSWLFLKRVEA